MPKKNDAFEIEMKSLEKTPKSTSKNTLSLGSNKTQSNPEASQSPTSGDSKYSQIADENVKEPRIWTNCWNYIFMVLKYR